ncbi:hypothetical protein THRCLA_06969 [Thraustotheca clavata]|uniref:Selenoprotein T n=1 Tax=Thraustotheca clavata TaxID=74557 RepID=A0A1V9ZHE2_9STRA|nr:hypothetical protein THRCLA_06969 [Thraustotheca clavata]
MGRKKNAAAEKKSDDRIRIEYDKNAFSSLYRQINSNLKREFPQIQTSTKSYPVAPNKSRLITLVFMIQAVFAIVIMFGETIVEKLELTIDPSWMQKFRENKFIALPIVMILSPIRHMLNNTGAFEVYLNDELIFSMLQTRVYLTYEELKKLLKNKGLHPKAK